MVQYLHKVVLTQPGVASMLCGMDGIQDAYPAYLWHKGWGGGQSMHFGTSRFGVGALKMVPISTVASYNEIAKLYSSVFPSLGKVLAGSSLFNSFFKFSKWVSFTCSLGAFQSVAFAPDLRASFFVAGTLSAGALFHTFLSFSWSESPLIFKTICFVGLSFHLDKIIMVFI